jgi:RNA polymerase sigma-70 factor (ECF subfamily)
MNREDQSRTQDSELVSRTKSGDVEAFGTLYERYVERIYKYIRVRVTEVAVAEDITENVFLRAFEAIDRYQERGYAFSAYLYRIAQNHLVDYYRKKKEEAPIEVAEQISADVTPLDENLIRNDQVQEVQKALATLPEDYQEVIRLRVLLELQTTEVAEWLDRSEGAVRVLLHRALKALRESVDERNRH